LGVFLVSLLAVFASDSADECIPFLVIGLWLTVFVMLFNPLIAQHGNTVLLYLPELPLIGRLRITLEAICYGAAMGVRLMTIILAFAFYNAVVHPDKVTGLVSRFAWKSSLVVSLATRMIPSAARDLSSAKDVMQLRGVDFSAGTFRERLKKYTWLLEVLLLSSLEGSLATAEAMQARGFGAGRRSCYRRELVRPRDYLCFFSGLSALLLAVYAKLQGYADFLFYPEFSSFAWGSELIWLVVIVLCLSIPLILSWGWKHWPYLRSKI
ncbi:MAG: energy-coupling factor transporter transmembrane component T, partial [Thermacetogeniaceae bacterium]